MSVRKLASIQKIKSLSAIPNSDNLELAQVLGWQTVVHKGEFKEGELIIYFEVDSFIPVRPELEFLRKSCLKKTDFGEGFRIKTIRLRGIVSQGLVMPLSILNDKDYESDVKEGDEVTELLGVKQYQPPMPACLKGLVKGSFPNFAPRSDETRAQLLQDVLTRHKGIKCYVTEKIDGTSSSYFIKDGEFGVCSRNLEMLDNDNAYWKIAKELEIEKKLRSLNKNIMLQGEIFGTGIQENPLKLDKKKVLFFNAFDIDSYKYYDYLEFFALMQQLGLETVPIITANYTLIDDINELVKFATAKSMINPKVWREGIVIRPIKEVMDMQLAQGFGNGRLSFKVINPEYLIDVEQ